MAIGRTESFATTQAPQDRILESMSYVDSLDYRRKQDLAKQAEAQAKAKADKEKEIQADLDKIKTSVTGKKTFDAPAIQAISSLRDGIANKARDYEQGKISKTDYLTYVRNAENSASILNQKAGFINEQGKSFAKMLEEGKLADGFEEGALSFAKAYENGQTILEDDGNGNLTYVVYGVDEQGNPNSIIEKGGLENFGNTSLTPILKVDFDKEQKVFKDNNPLGLVESIDGQIKTGVKKVTPTLDSNIRAYAEARLKDKNALLSAYKKATGEADMNVMEDTGKVKIAEDWLYNSIKNSYQEEIMKDEATQRGNLGLGWARLNKEEVKPSYNVVETPQEFYKSGVNPAKGYKTVSNTSSKPTIVPSITVYDPKKKGDKEYKGDVLNGAIMNSYTVEKKPNGERSISAMITYPDIKTSTLTAPQKELIELSFKAPESLTPDQQLEVSRITKGAEYKTKVVRLNEKDAVKFKRDFGSEDANQMKNLAKTGEEEQVKSSSGVNWK